MHLTEKGTGPKEEGPGGPAGAAHLYVLGLEDDAVCALPDAPQNAVLVHRPPAGARTGLPSDWAAPKRQGPAAKCSWGRARASSALSPRPRPHAAGRLIRWRSPASGQRPPPSAEQQPQQTPARRWESPKEIRKARREGGAAGPGGRGFRLKGGAAGPGGRGLELKGGAAGPTGRGREG